MSRSIVIVLALGLVAPIAHAQPGDERLATLTADVDAEAFVDDGEGEGEYAEDEEYLEEDIEYCGDGEMSVVDAIWDEMEYGDARRAYENLVGALQSGEVESWERGRALAILAELQLRRGEPGRALVNFRRAEQIDPGVTEASRVAIATALLRRGENELAREEARTAHEELCVDAYAVAGCYTANLILARTEPDADARQAALDAAATLRSGNTDLESAFAAADARVTGS